MAVTPFATTVDLTDRWRSLSPAESDRAGFLLADASTIVVAECGTAVDADMAKIVVCDMVRRAMLTPADQPSMTQIQQTTGPFSFGGTLANPSGDLYLTKAEKRRLRSGQQAGYVDLWSPPVTP